MSIKDILEAVKKAEATCEHCDCCIGDYAECAFSKGLINEEDLNKYYENQE